MTKKSWLFEKVLFIKPFDRYIISREYTVLAKFLKLWKIVVFIQLSGNIISRKVKWIWGGSEKMIREKQKTLNFN